MSNEQAELDLVSPFDPATCVRRGLCPVTELRPQGPEALEKHSLYFEQHGRGTKYKVLLIMGLNSSCASWGPQVKHFGKSEDHTVVAFDNRGVGHSTYPRGPYSTSGMAEDIICLLEYIGWTAKREVHVVGVSLGGMIAQELASRIPERIASLVLTVTTPGGSILGALPTWKGFSCLVRLTFIKEPEKKVPLVFDMLFPRSWLEEMDEDDPKRKNREVQTEGYIRRFMLTPKQQLTGNFSQMTAVLTHYVSNERLRAISANIPRIVILTGDEDYLVDPSKSRQLAAAMPEAEFFEWSGTGHGLATQRAKKFNALLEQTFELGRQRVEAGFVSFFTHPAK